LLDAGYDLLDSILYVDLELDAATLDFGDFCMAVRACSSVQGTYCSSQ
jgi:hypothetical protein